MQNAPPRPRLADSEACFRELLATVNLLAVIINDKSEITYCNEYFLHVTGWTWGEVEGRLWRDIFPLASFDRFNGLLADLFKGMPSAWHNENDLFTRSGERRYIRWNNILLRDESGRGMGAASIGEDITERRSLEREILDSSASERRNLQCELHDGLGQELFGIALHSRSIATSADRGGPVVAEELVKLSAMASHAVETCRRIAQGLSPLSDVHGGLFHAVEQLTRTPPDWSGPILEFKGSRSAPIRLSSDALDHVYRVAQEGLTNALKHASARTIVLSLEVRSDVIVLDITDDGVGLPPNYASTDGVGQRIMQYRASHLLARLDVTRRAEGGTRLTLTCRQD